jgi:hypothetical protein
MALRFNGPRHVRIVATMLIVLGSGSLCCGFVAGAALGRDVRTDGTLRQVAFGPALIVSGALALSAGVKNQRFGSRGRGLLALAVLAAVGLTYFPPLNPCSAVALYGFAVYLSPPGRDAFRRTIIDKW